MQNKIDASAVVWLHDRQLRERDWPVLSRMPVQAGAWQWIDMNHRYNGLSWRERARTGRLDLPPAEIAAGERLVERYDRKRGDAVEALDASLRASLRAAQPAAAASLAAPGGAAPRPGTRPSGACLTGACLTGACLSGVTPGAMIDRLSGLALWIHHLRAQAGRADAGEAHVQACAIRLERCLAQRLDLMYCLDALLAALLADACAGRASFKLDRRSRQAAVPPRHAGGTRQLG